MQKYLYGQIIYANKVLGSGILVHTRGAILTSRDIVQQVIKFDEQSQPTDMKNNLIFHAILTPISEDGSSSDPIEISVPAYVLPHSVESIFGLFMVEHIAEDIKAIVGIPTPTIITKVDAPFKSYSLQSESSSISEEIPVEPNIFLTAAHPYGFAFETTFIEKLHSGSPIFNRHDQICGLLIESEGQWGVASLPDIENMMEYSENKNTGVMLSYKREEVALVDIFREQLMLRGIPNIWMDIQKIKTGQQW